jgi:hypothetical protein
MAEVVRTTRKQSLQTAYVIAGAAVTFNLLFSLASYFYYDGKPAIEVADAGKVRFAAALMSVIVAGMSYLAALAPRAIGHGLAFVMGVASIVGGIAAFAKGLPPVMATTLVVTGALVPVLAARSLLAHSRGAWSFLIAIMSVFACVYFFGAPKIRHLLDIGLWHAMIIPGLQIVCVIALAMLRGEYRDRL